MSKVVTYFSVFNNGVHNIRLTKCLSWRAYYCTDQNSLWAATAVFSGAYFQPSLTFFQTSVGNDFPIEVRAVPGYFIEDEFTISVSGLSPGESFVLQQTVLID